MVNIYDKHPEVVKDFTELIKSSNLLAILSHLRLWGFGLEPNLTEGEFSKLPPIGQESYTRAAICSNIIGDLIKEKFGDEEVEYAVLDLEKLYNGNNGKKPFNRTKLVYLPNQLSQLVAPEKVEATLKSAGVGGEYNVGEEYKVAAAGGSESSKNGRVSVIALGKNYKFKKRSWY